jgi:serine/threonine protein kinase
MMLKTWRWMLTKESADIKPDNILVNYNPLVEFDPKRTRISTARLADLGNTVLNDSEYARDGFPIGAPIFRSPRRL